MDTLFETQPAAGATGRAFRVLVTGSRTWDVPSVVGQALADACLTAVQAGRRELIVVHGGCPSGADRYAARWAARAPGEFPGADGSRSRLRVLPEVHAAEWEKHGRQAAGFIRNAVMVALGADSCLAFVRQCAAVKCAGKPAHDSHGTADCAARARAAGIPVHRYAS